MLDLVSKITSDIVSNGISSLVSGDVKAKSIDTTDSAPQSSSDSSDFEGIIRQFLPADDAANVSEEELFAAAAGERVFNLKGDDGLKSYQKYLESEKAALTSSGGHVQNEQAAINALKKLVADNVLSTEQGDQIYTESFAAAQLDGNADSLFDEIGGANDPTMAVAKMSEAMLKIKSFLEADASTRANLGIKSLAAASQTGSASTPASAGLTANVNSAPIDGTRVTPSGTYVDGSEGFLFKPVTNNEGKLAVMFAQSWTNNIAAVKLLDQSGNLIENGVRKPEGIKETGREKFVFNKTGSAYPSNLAVEVTFQDGSTKLFDIPDPSKRYD